MTERIYLLNEHGDPDPLVETAYESEAALQELIARHPEVLAGEQMTPDEPRRWLLISREMGIGDSADSGGRWAVDHLLLDQDGHPTLVEVKRGDNPEVRRSVVGQMLEYAAHATRYWSIDGIRARFEAAEQGGALEKLAWLLDVDGEPDADEYWELVSTNLRAGNLRLLFVADRIPDELRHVVEFLNEHMTDVDVLAVELKQFQSGTVRTLVPRVIGRSAKRRAPGTSRPPMTIESFLPEFPEGTVREAARQLLERSLAAGAAFEWGSRGVSIRGRCSRWNQPVTVAWLYPSSVGWGRTPFFSFGSGIIEDQSLPQPLRELLLRYVSQFADDPYTEDASSQGVEAWAVSLDAAAEHIETLAVRVETVLRDLAQL